MKRSKNYKAKKNNKNIDSNEIAREIAVETIKDTEKIFQKVGCLLYTF